MKEQTTLYIRGVPAQLVRKTKAAAAQRGETLATLVTEALARSLDNPVGSHGPPASALDADMRWYAKNRVTLVKKYDGQYVAIVNAKVVDHDHEFGPLAERVFKRYSMRSIFMPRVQLIDPVMRVRSPRLKKA